MVNEVGVETLAPGEVAGHPGMISVTSENFAEFVNDKLGPLVPPETENEDPEEVAAREAAELEAQKAEPKEGDERDGKVFFKGKFVTKHDFAYRLHLKTQEVEAKAAAELKVAREEAAAAVKERDELRTRYEPPVSQELGPEPQAYQFADVADYGKALKAWVARQAVAEDRAQREQEALTRSWEKRIKAAQESIPDYAEKITASPVKVSDQVRDAILESDVGPQLLYHLAEHPDVAEALGKLTVRKALIELGKIEATLDASERKVEPEVQQKIEVSRAPAPITPLRGTGSPTGLKFDANGNWLGTAEEWAAGRRSGKIK